MPNPPLSEVRGQYIAEFNQKMAQFDPNEYRNSTDGVVLGWREAYIESVYVSMFEGSGDSTYLARISQDFDIVLSNRSDHFDIWDYAHNRVMAGWISTSESKGTPTCWLVHAANVEVPIARWVYLTKKDPVLSVTYADKILSYTLAIQETITSFDIDWRDLGADEGYYYSPILIDVLPFNQQNAMGHLLVTMWLITGEPSYLTKAIKLGNFFKNRLSELRGGYIWLYWSMRSVISDMGHAALDFEFAFSLYRIGVVFTYADILKFFQMFQNNKVLDEMGGITGWWQRLDGTGVVGYNGEAAYYHLGWLDEQVAWDLATPLTAKHAYIPPFMVELSVPFTFDHNLQGINVAKETDVTDVSNIGTYNYVFVDDYTTFQVNNTQVVATSVDGKLSWGSYVFPSVGSSYTYQSDNKEIKVTWDATGSYYLTIVVSTISPVVNPVIINPPVSTIPTYDGQVWYQVHADLARSLAYFDKKLSITEDAVNTIIASYDVSTETDLLYPIYQLYLDNLPTTKQSIFTASVRLLLSYAENRFTTEYITLNPNTSVANLTISQFLQMKSFKISQQILAMALDDAPTVDSRYIYPVGSWEFMLPLLDYTGLVTNYSFVVDVSSVPDFSSIIYSIDSSTAPNSWYYETNIDQFGNMTFEPVGIGGVSSRFLGKIIKFVSPPKYYLTSCEVYYFRFAQKYGSSLSDYTTWQDIIYT